MKQVLFALLLTLGGGSFAFAQMMGGAPMHFNPPAVHSMPNTNTMHHPKANIPPKTSTVAPAPMPMNNTTIVPSEKKKKRKKSKATQAEGEGNSISSN